MTTCYYHPETKAKSVCPECGEDICDVCRLEGGLQRCGHCAANGPPAGGPRLREEEPAAVVLDGGAAAERRMGGPGGGGYGAYDGGGAPPAHDMAAMLEVMCSNHPGINADMQCLNCLQAFCMDCLPNGAMCAECNVDPSGRAAPQEDYVPQPIVDVGYDPGLDFSDGYSATGHVPASGYEQGYEQSYEQSYEQGYGDADFATGYGEAPAPKPKRPPGAKRPPPGGAKKGGAAAAKKGPAAKGKKAGGPPVALIAGGVGALALVGALGWFFMGGSGGSETSAMGPAKVSITAPKSAGPLKGLQLITLQVASADEIQKVEVRVDGKYWQKFSHPPFKTEWQSSLVKNGKHTIEAVAEYKNGTKVSDKKTVTIANPR